MCAARAAYDGTGPSRIVTAPLCMCDASCSWARNDARPAGSRSPCACAIVSAMYADALREHSREAWVLWDFRGSNPVLWEVLGTERPGTSRRAVLILRPDAEPRLVCSVLDRPLLDRAGVPLDVYATREELIAKLGRFDGRVAMEYSPNNALPIVSFADAGAVELIRSLGADVVSSADLFQTVAAAWDEEAEASHHRAVEHVMALHELARA